MATPLSLVFALGELEKWLSLDGEQFSAQLFVSRSKNGYEVGFCRFGVLMQKTSKGATLQGALLRAAADVVDAIELDKEVPDDLKATLEEHKDKL